MQLTTGEMIAVIFVITLGGPLLLAVIATRIHKWWTHKPKPFEDQWRKHEQGAMDEINSKRSNLVGVQPLDAQLSNRHHRDLVTDPRDAVQLLTASGGTIKSVDGKDVDPTKEIVFYEEDGQHHFPFGIPPEHLKMQMPPMKLKIMELQITEIGRRYIQEMQQSNQARHQQRTGLNHQTTYLDDNGIRRKRETPSGEGVDALPGFGSEG